MDNYNNSNMGDNNQNVHEGQYNAQDQNYAQSQNFGQPPVQQVKNPFAIHLVFSIIEIITCLLFGILSLVFTIQGNNLFKQNRIEEAKGKYKVSTIMLIIGLVLTIITVVLSAMFFGAVMAYLENEDQYETTYDDDYYDDTEDTEDADDAEDEDFEDDELNTNAASSYDSSMAAGMIENFNTKSATYGYSQYADDSTESTILSSGADAYGVTTDADGNTMQVIIGNEDIIEQYAQTFYSQYDLTDQEDGIYFGEYAGLYVSMCYTDNALIVGMKNTDDSSVMVDFDDQIIDVITSL